MYNYWTLQVLTVALVALALTEWWFLRLKDVEVPDDIPAQSYTGESYTDQVVLPEIPECFRRRPLPVLIPDDTPKEADRFVRSGR